MKTLLSVILLSTITSAFADEPKWECELADNKKNVLKSITLETDTYIGENGWQYSKFSVLYNDAKISVSLNINNENLNIITSLFEVEGEGNTAYSKFFEVPHYYISEIIDIRNGEYTLTCENLNKQSPSFIRIDSERDIQKELVFPDNDSGSPIDSNVSAE